MQAAFFIWIKQAAIFIFANRRFVSTIALVLALIVTACFEVSRRLEGGDDSIDRVPINFQQPGLTILYFILPVYSSLMDTHAV